MISLHACNGTVRIKDAPVKVIIEARLQNTLNGHLHVLLTDITDEFGCTSFNFPFGQHIAPTLRILDEQNETKIVQMVFDPIDSDEEYLVFISAAEYVAHMQHEPVGEVIDVPSVPQPDLTDYTGAVYAEE